MKNSIVKQDDLSMTLYEIVSLINTERDVKDGEKGFLAHSRQMTKIDKLIAEAPNFGPTKKVGVTAGNNIEIETYVFNKEQAIAAAARIDNTRLMMVVKKLTEYEDHIKQIQEDGKTLISNEVITHISQLMPKGEWGELNEKNGLAKTKKIRAYYRSDRNDELSVLIGKRKRFENLLKNSLFPDEIQADIDRLEPKIQILKDAVKQESKDRKKKLLK